MKVYWFKTPDWWWKPYISIREEESVIDWKWYREKHMPGPWAGTVNATWYPLDREIKRYAFVFAWLRLHFRVHW